MGCPEINTKSSPLSETFYWHDPLVLETELLQWLILWCFFMVGAFLPFLPPTLAATTIQLVQSARLSRSARGVIKDTRYTWC